MNIPEGLSDTPNFCSEMKDIIAYAPKNTMILEPLKSKCNEKCEPNQCIANTEPEPTCSACCDFSKTLPDGDEQLATAAYCKLWCKYNDDEDSGVCDTILMDNISIPDIISKITNIQLELDRLKKATDCSLDDDGNCVYKSKNLTGVICFFVLMSLLIVVISFAMRTK